MIKNLILKISIWLIFLRNKDPLPTESKIINPEMKYEVMSGAFMWEDEGLWEHRNHNLKNAFKYVISYRMKLILGPDHDVGFMHSLKFDKKIFEMAKKHFPNWIGFDKARCSYNAELADRILRIQKVEKWRFQKLLNEE